MRRPGNVFVELYVEDPSPYARLFRDALGFSILRDEGDFVVCQSARGTVLLNRFDDPSPGHPFEDYRAHARRGMGVEIGFALEPAALRNAWSVARTFEGFSVTEIVEQEWGMTDFRIVTPHGYYLRITTPQPGE